MGVYVCAHLHLHLRFQHPSSIAVVSIVTTAFINIVFYFFDISF